MSAIDTGLALLGGIVKAFTNPQVDRVVDVVVEALQGVDDIVRNAQDGDWGAEDEADLARALQDNFNAVGLDDAERAEALANGLAAGLSLLIEAALERRKEGPRPQVRKVGAFFAERRKAPAPPQDDDLDQGYSLTGENPFKTGVNAQIWNILAPTTWTRARLLGVVANLVASKQTETIRSPETIVRDFLGRVQEKGRLQRL